MIRQFFFVVVAFCSVPCLAQCDVDTCRPGPDDGEVAAVGLEAFNAAVAAPEPMRAVRVAVQPMPTPEMALPRSDERPAATFFEPSQAYRVRRGFFGRRIIVRPMRGRFLFR